ncbi:unnamed protein product [Ambrosiozyma monospora]|uniref:Unnamed protein product n=1 Tax=Ambrosiozyma monospora TaxID=43982 RepID=A0A9W6YYN5_AMBMO|nr:unnamed protein product [Ambrosiozyma monospora]
MIEMATKVIMGLPVTPYPGEKLPDDYCAIKVPQFSFSRLSGADPVLGVEMASTGEVACFGHNKYEAYLKSLISTGFQMPKKNILLSIGSYKEKVELLPSIKKMYELGYSLFATAGTADFIQEHGVPIKYLELLNEDEEEQKAEYSLTQHLANNLIDLYINLPSSNRFRRPASYVSKGYRTRRMAVDYAVPLITNVKNAKLLIEALARNIALDVSSIDAQTSHNTIEMPGLVNISTFIPSLEGQSPAYNFEETTKTAVASGFTFTSILPLSSDGPTIVDARSLSKAHESLHGSIFTDFAFSVAATEDNANLIEHVSGLTSALYLPSKAFGPEKLSAASTHFASWVETKPIITDCRTTDLASTLLLASLYNKKIHVTGVTRKEDLALVQMSKEKNLAVTCDVSVYALFLTKEDYPGVSFLPSKEDQKALWDNIEIIDAFSVGTLPSRLAEFLGKPVTPGLGFADTLPLLFRAVSEGKLTIADIISKLHDAPIQILGLTDNESTIEVDTDRLISSLKGKISSSSNFSPFAGQPLKGAVERVHMNGQTVCLEGDFLVKEALGKESAFLVQHSSKLVESQPDTPLGIIFGFF